MSQAGGGMSATERAQFKRDLKEAKKRSTKYLPSPSSSSSSSSSSSYMGPMEKKMTLKELSRIPLGFRPDSSDDDSDNGKFTFFDDDDDDDDGDLLDDDAGVDTDVAPPSFPPPKTQEEEDAELARALSYAPAPPSTNAAQPARRAFRPKRLAFCSGCNVLPNSMVTSSCWNVERMSTATVSSSDGMPGRWWVVGA